VKETTTHTKLLSNEVCKIEIANISHETHAFTEYPIVYETMAIVCWLVTAF
jgi:hypothetical protein